MSRNGKKPVLVPKDVKIECSNGIVKADGPKGKAAHQVAAPITVEIVENTLLLKRPDDSIESKVKHGTARSMVANLVAGVSAGFEKRLIIEGVGFKAQLAGRKLTLNLGYSHPINLEVPEGLTVKAASPTDVSVSGIDSQRVGEFAAKIRSCYEPEPYKGKGVRYSDEVIRRKAGKSVAK